MSELLASGARYIEAVAQRKIGPGNYAFSLLNMRLYRIGGGKWDVSVFRAKDGEYILHPRNIKFIKV